MPPQRRRPGRPRNHQSPQSQLASQVHNPPARRIYRDAAQMNPLRNLRVLRNSTVQATNEVNRRNPNDTVKTPFPDSIITRSDFDFASVPYCDVGKFNKRCPNCNALSFNCLIEGQKEQCRVCKNSDRLLDPAGDPLLKPLPALPDSLKPFFYPSDNPDEIAMKKNIRVFNNMFAFSSLRCEVATNRHIGVPYPFIFVGGQLSHQIKDLPQTIFNRPHENQTSTPTEGVRFAQIYTYDPDEATRIRISNNPFLQQSQLGVVHDIEIFMRDHNPFASLYQNASKILTQLPSIPWESSIKLVRQQMDDKNTYSTPTGDEIAALINKHNPTGSLPQRMVLTTGGEFRSIDHTSELFFPSHLPFLFPFGEGGWQAKTQTLLGTQHLSLASWANYRSAALHDDKNYIVHGGKLFQEFITSGYAVNQLAKVNYIRQNQTQIRADQYKNLDGDDVLNDDRTRGIDLGSPANILPSSVVGSPRYMFNKYADSMALLSYYGRPSLFVTITANPHWKEVLEALSPGEKPEDRFDLVSSVFHLKIKAFLHKVEKGHLLGDCKAYSGTVEYQKRGTPHLHLLVWNDWNNEQLNDPAFIDSIISAELPEDETSAEYQSIKKYMLHTSCMPTNRHRGHTPTCFNSSGHCSKGFPKPLCEGTVILENNYPQYRRRPATPINDTNPQLFLNQYVVPHSRVLSATMDCHVNLEVVNTVKAIKYIHKYLNKSPQSSHVQFTGNDECQSFVDSFYFGPNESFESFRGYRKHFQFPPVNRLDVHAPSEQNIFFNSDDNPDEIRNHMGRSTSKLLEFFKLSTRILAGEYDDETNGQQFRDLLYKDVPRFFSWDNSRKTWKRRKNSSFQIGRIYNVHFRRTDAFAIKLLLSTVPIPTSFEDLRTYNGELYHTFHEAAEARGLTQSDKEWEKALDEAYNFGNPNPDAFRRFFASILMQCSVANPLALFTKFKSELSEKLEEEAVRRHAIRTKDDATPELLVDLAVQIINELTDFAFQENLPHPLHDWNMNIQNRLLFELSDYDPVPELEIYNKLHDKLNDDQRNCFDTIINSVQDFNTNKDLNALSHPSCYFLNGSAGCGKTFLYRCLISKLRSERKIVICLASSGIAATLMPGGRTGHSFLKIPLHLSSDSFCDISKNSDLAGVIKSTSLIIWDEAVMMRSELYEAVDRTFKDIMENDIPFGGIPFVLAGDFKQILPVIPKASFTDVLANCLFNSDLWPHFVFLHLTQNRRLLNDTSGYSDWVLKLGDNTFNNDPINHITYKVRPFSSQNIVTSREELIKVIYDNLGPTHHQLSPHLSRPANIKRLTKYFKKRSILACTNSEVRNINKSILLNVIDPDVEPIKLIAANSLPDDATEAQKITYPPEILSGFQPQGFPPSVLELKVGCPLISIRNICPKKGLCNGTRLLLVNISQRALGTIIISEGPHFGETAYIPRIDFISDESSGMPTTFRRRQFPVSLCFSMTINKSQGQTLKHVGLDLTATQVFSHGQLYVALSRVTDSSTLFIAQESIDDSLVNVIYIKPSSIFNNVNIQQ